MTVEWTQEQIKQYWLNDMLQRQATYQNILADYIVRRPDLVERTRRMLDKIADSIYKIEEGIPFHETRGFDPVPSSFTDIRVRYEDYIKSPEWKQKSDDAKARAGFKCQLCGNRKELTTHHNTYRNLGHEPPEDLIVLCWKCHKTFHEEADLYK